MIRIVRLATKKTMPQQQTGLFQLYRARAFCGSVLVLLFSLASHMATAATLRGDGVAISDGTR